MKYYSYISTRASYDPCKTILVFAPDEACATYEGVRQFAKDSGWQTLAELDSAVLVVPVAEDGWENQPSSVFCELYDAVRNNCPSQNGNSLIGRRGMLWLWETLIYVAGYKEGAVFAHKCALEYPNHFASALLVDGVYDQYDALEKPSDHWFVKNVSDDYHVLNKDIPVSLWLVNTEKEKSCQAIERYASVNHYDPEKGSKVMINGYEAVSYADPENSAAQVLYTEGSYAYDIRIAEAALTGLFDHVIRWKNSPDGTLACIPGHRDFYQDGIFRTDSVEINRIVYSFSVHVPEGLNEEQIKGLPLVFTVHGRGEPAWLFAVKNGWRELCDETKEFVLIAPDSPGNIWFYERDRDAFKAMIDKMETLYRIDRERVYLTGFSNGGQITREVGTSHPDWFAGIAPFNGPAHLKGFSRDDAVDLTILEKGYELPYFVSIGDNDGATGLDIDDQLEVMIKANGGQPKEGTGFSKYGADEYRDGNNYYTEEAGYKDGSRLRTLIYRNENGTDMVAFTVMKNMPHGQTADQTRAAWNFLKRFRRREGDRKITVL